MTTPTADDADTTQHEDEVPTLAEPTPEAGTEAGAEASTEAIAGPAAEVPPVAAPAPPPPFASSTSSTPPPPLASTSPAQPAAAGQHAAPRPYPPVPPVGARETSTSSDPLAPPAPTPAVAPVVQAAPAAATAPIAAAPPAPQPVAPQPVAPQAAAPQRAPEAPTAVLPATPERPVLVDLPRRPGAKRHLLGVLLGLVLTPLGLVLAAMGVGHMVDLAPGEGALDDVFGLVLLLAGALVLAIVTLLARWSPAVPITGGALWGIGGGGLALWDPQGVHDAVHGVTDGRFIEVTIDHILDPALTGSLLVLGVVLLCAGIAAGLARGAGRSFGTRTVAAERARAEAERLEAADREAEARRAESARSIR